MKLKLAVFSFVLALAFAFAQPTLADDYGCSGQYGQYGGCPTSQNILINKLVAKPGTTDFVDNLSASDPRFGPGSTVLFRLIVKNTSTVVLNNVTVKDIVPAYLDPVEGPGNYDANSRTISFNAGNFNPDEQKTYDLKMQVVAQNQLPSDKGIVCVTNTAQAYTSNVFDDDTAQLCIEKQVLGITQVPSTGPEFGLALVAGELLTLGLGFSLKKRSK